MREKSMQIAIIGGGFSGLSVAYRLLYLAEKNKQKIALTIFEKSPSTQSGAFSIELPNNFTLNQEADFMGSLNPNNSNTDDFFLWIQEMKNIPLESLYGQTIKEKYNEFELNNPKAFLPRSLYGVYLDTKLRELIKNSRGEYYSFTYKQEEVISIKKKGEKFIITTNLSKEAFDISVICNGYAYPVEGKENIVYSREIYTKITTLAYPKEAKIGIIGMGLSGIEIALALVEKGYKKVNLYSRTGRLPKVRGEKSDYTLQYLTPVNLDAIKKNNGYIRFYALLELLKKEFAAAYIDKKTFSLKEIFFNKNSIEQLESDIKSSENEKELVWRSVSLAIAKIKPLILPYLSLKDELTISKNYGSLILSFLAPIPLFQAKKLLKYVKEKVISIKKDVVNYRYSNSRWQIEYSNNSKDYVDYLIDAKGPIQNIESISLVKSLLENNLVEKSSIRGVRVNATFQSVVNSRPIANFYMLGSIWKAYAPINNSTVYLGNYIQTICNKIFESFAEEKQVGFPLYKGGEFL